ncbi:unnamed protein product, partial [Tilletia caries]
ATASASGPQCVSSAGGRLASSRGIVRIRPAFEVLRDRVLGEVKAYVVPCRECYVSPRRDAHPEQHSDDGLVQLPIWEGFTVARG